MGKKNKNLKFNSSNILYALTVFVLSIVILNLLALATPLKNNSKVLGIEAKNTEGVFWYGFLKEHPDYIPGWIEIGRTDKARNIDPNYY